MIARRITRRASRGLRTLALLPLLALAAMESGEEEAAAPETLHEAPAASVGQALIDTPGAEARIPLEMEAPGIVAASFTAELADKGLEAEIFNPMGESLGKGAAFNFIPGTVEVVVRDPKGEFARAEPVPVILEVRPEADFLEPNSEEHPARIRLNKWYENVLTPSDTDHFVINVREPGILHVEHQGREGRFDKALRPQAGTDWSTYGYYEAKAGRHMLRFTDRSPEPELEPFRFRVVWLPPRNDEPRELPLDTAVPVLIAQPDAREHFVVKVPQSGMLSLSVMGEAPERTVVELRAGEDRVTGAQVRKAVKAGTYEIQVYANYNNASLRPFYLLANLYRTTDAGEPNDSRAEAVPAALDEPFRISLYPGTDTDWFRFEIRQAGHLTLHLETSHENRHRAVRSLQAWAEKKKEESGETAESEEKAEGGNEDGNAERPLEQLSVPTAVNDRATRFGPFKVSPGPLYISSFNKYRDMPRMDFAVTPEFRPAGEEKKGGQVFVIGLSLSDKAKAEMAALTDATGGVYVDAESADVLRARIEEVKRRAEREADRRLGRSGGGWIWLVLILAAAGGAGYYYRDRLRETARIYGWFLRPNLPKMPGMAGRADE